MDMDADDRYNDEQDDDGLPEFMDQQDEVPESQPDALKVV